jgi:hypothetical protein
VRSRQLVSASSSHLTTSRVSVGALFDYQAETEDEISFSAGDRILVFLPPDPERYVILGGTDCW